MTQAKAARILGKSASSWKRYRREGKVPARLFFRGLGGRVEVRDLEFYEWLGQLTAGIRPVGRRGLEEHLFPERRCRAGHTES